MNTCKHNRVGIWENTRWVVNRETKTVEIDLEEWDESNHIYCFDCQQEMDSESTPLESEVIAIIENVRDNS